MRLFLTIGVLGLIGQAFAQEPVLLQGPGKIRGKVRIEGNYQKPQPLKVYKNRDFCGYQVRNESLLVGNQGGVKNVVVIAHPLDSGPAKPLPKLVKLDNQNCLFVPHVKVVPLGSEILLLNSDPILHDVHARIGSDTLFNVGLPAWRQVKKRLNRTGIVVIQCDVLHTWMSAYIVVTSSPHFGVTDQRGKFVIEGVPAGTYEIEVWHEQLGRRLRTVRIREAHAVRFDFVYRLGKRDS